MSDKIMTALLGTLGCDESDSVVLVLIGFPGSGKTETGYTRVSKRDFKTVLQSPGSKKQQEAHSVLGDLHVTVRDTTGFESITAFWDLYNNSLKDLEMRKVVFGLTIGTERLQPGFTTMLQTLFRENKIGEHLKHKTLIIFTKVDELLNDDEVDYEDKFEEWLSEAEEINQLITSLNLNYCVIQNKQSGDKRDKEAAKVVKKLKGLSQTQIEIELDNGNEYMNFSQIEVKASKDDSKPKEDDNDEDKYEKLIKKEFQISFAEMFALKSKLVQAKDKHSKTIIMHDMLLKHGFVDSPDIMAHANSILQTFEEINTTKCSLDICNVL